MRKDKFTLNSYNAAVIWTLYWIRLALSWCSRLLKSAPSAFKKPGDVQAFLNLNTHHIERLVTCEGLSFSLRDSHLTGVLLSVWCRWSESNLADLSFNCSSSSIIQHVPHCLAASVTLAAVDAAAVLQILLIQFNIRSIMTIKHFLKPDFNLFNLERA